MARALSNDLRERVVAAVAGGESCRSVAARFEVAVSSVVKWSQRKRRTGSVATDRSTADLSAPMSSSSSCPTVASLQGCGSLPNLAEAVRGA